MKFCDTTTFTVVYFKCIQSKIIQFLLYFLIYIFVNYIIQVECNKIKSRLCINLMTLLFIFCSSEQILKRCNNLLFQIHVKEFSVLNQKFVSQIRRGNQFADVTSSVPMNSHLFAEVMERLTRTNVIYVRKLAKLECP